VDDTDAVPQPTRGGPASGDVASLPLL